MLKVDVRVKTCQVCEKEISLREALEVAAGIPDMATIILATPQSKVTQTKGRVERIFDGKKSPVVMDIVDSFYEPARTWSIKRHKEYAESEMQIKKFNYVSFLK